MRMNGFSVFWVSLALAWTIGPGIFARNNDMRLHSDLIFSRTPQRDLKMDLYLPSRSSGPVPVIVWIHGGGWIAGGKANPRPLWMTGEGYAVASIQYRFITEAPFPAQLLDCKAAIRWLRANAAQYGLDPGRIGVWGASAGGHLAALLGTTGGSAFDQPGPNLQFSSRVQAVCDFYGPTDLSRLGPLIALLGEVEGEPSQAHAELSEAARLARLALAAANPIRYVTQDDPPFLIMHGERDPLVPVSQSRLLFDALEKAGVEAELEIIPGAGHYLRGREIDRSVLAFFARHLGTPQTSSPQLETLSEGREPDR